MDWVRLCLLQKTLEKKAFYSNPVTSGCAHPTSVAQVDHTRSKHHAVLLKTPPSLQLQTPKVLSRVDKPTLLTGSGRREVTLSCQEKGV